jgi:hypothetical protein
LLTSLSLCAILVRSDPGQTEVRTSRRANVPKYVIERDLPGAGNLSPDKLRAVSQKSRAVLEELGPQIQWLESYVTADKLYCVYIAPSEELIREHARRGGFPAGSVSEVKTMIDPTTAEAHAG